LAGLRVALVALAAGLAGFFAAFFFAAGALPLACFAEDFFAALATSNPFSLCGEIDSQPRVLPVFYPPGVKTGAQH